MCRPMAQPLVCALLRAGRKQGGELKSEPNRTVRSSRRPMAVLRAGAGKSLRTCREGDADRCVRRKSRCPDFPALLGNL